MSFGYQAMGFRSKKPQTSLLILHLNTSFEDCIFCRSRVLRLDEVEVKEEAAAQVQGFVCFAIIKFLSLLQSQRMWTGLPQQCIVPV